jgi:tetratricopeptide (TPR) repeat protein
MDEGAGRIDATDSGLIAGRDVHQHGQYVAGRDLHVYEHAYPRLAYRREIGQLLAFYNTVFVGRQAELERLAGFAAHSVPGYLLVEAPSAYGKSALAAQLLHRHETGQWDRPTPRLVYFFIREDGRRHTPEAFCSAVNSQLLELLDEPGEVPPDLERQRSQLLHLWARAVQEATPDRPLLLLVDGLDEVVDAQVSIADLLPGDLGPHVHVVVTSRPNPRPLDQVPLEHPLRRAEVLRLQRLQLAEIEQLLVAHGGSPQLASRLAPQVLEVTHGEPLLARFISQDVAGGGEQKLTELERNPPAGVKGYFLRQFAQLDARAEGDTSWEVLGVLLLAHGAMTIQELADVLQKPVRQLRRAVAPIHRFLLGRDRLELMHLELRTVLTDQFSPPERQAYRRRLLAWLNRFAEAGWPDDTPHYVLAHAATHLREAGDNEGLYALINKRWMDLKAARTHSHRAFAQDVLLAIDAAGAERPPNLAQEARGSLIYATLGSLAARVPTMALAVLARAGQVARAQGHAALIHDARQRTSAFCQISAALLRQGRAKEAAEAIDQALAAAELVQAGSSRASALTDVAWALAGAGQTERVIEVAEQALAAAKTVQPLGTRAAGLGRVAWALARAGQVERALAVVQAIERDRDRAHPLASVAQALLQAEQREQAARVAQQALAIAEGRASVLGRIARVLAQVGQTEQATRAIHQALAAAQSIELDANRAAALAGLAEALTELGQLGQAMKVAEQMGKRAADALAAAIGGKGKIAYFFHDANHYVTNQRDQAFLSTITGNYPDIDVVAKSGIADPNRAQDIATATLLKHPDLAGAYVMFAQPPGEGVLAALRANGATKTKLVTLDLDEPLALDMARGGQTFALVIDRAYDVGRAMARSAAYGLLGKRAPPFVIVPALTITRSNLVQGYRASLHRSPPASVMKALGK